MANPTKRIQARAKARRHSKADPYWNIRNAGNRTAEVTIYGMIGESLWDEGVGAKAIKDELDAFDGLETIDGYINTPGGSVPEGLAIHSIFARYRDAGVTVRMTVDGFANSIGSVIPQAASPGELRMHPGTMMMVHDPSTVTVGTAAEHRKTADVLDAARDSLVSVYASRIDMEASEIVELMSAETYMTAEKAVELGFADEVIESERDPAPVDFNPAQFGNFSRMMTAMAPAHREQITTVQIEPVATTTPTEAVDMPDTPAPAAATQERPVAAPVISLDDVRNVMREEFTTLQREATSERERIQAIGDIFDGLPNLAEIKAQAVTENWSVEKAKAAIFDHMNGEPTSDIQDNGMQVPSGADIRAGAQDDRTARMTGLSQAIMARGLPDHVKRDPQNQFNGYTLIDVAKECLRNTGEAVPNDRQRVIKNAFTHARSDFPHLLEDTINKSVMAGWDEQNETWNMWTSRMVLTDYREHALPNLEHFVNLAIVRAGAEYTHGTIGEARESIIAAKYGRLFSIDEETMVNDDQNAMTAVPNRMGAAAARVPGDLVYGILTANNGLGPLMSDGNNLFDAAHNNIGTPAAISDTTVEEMDLLMGLQETKTTDAEGNVDPSQKGLNIMPAYWIVPRAQRFTAMQLMNSAVEIGAANQTPNRVQSLATIVFDTRLDKSGNTDASTRNYMVASPASGMTIRVGFLDGVDTPQIDRQDGFTVDGVTYKVRIVCGASPADWRGMVVNAGV